jgi:hypothetical protein
MKNVLPRRYQGTKSDRNLYSRPFRKEDANVFFSLARSNLLCPDNTPGKHFAPVNPSLIDLFQKTLAQISPLFIYLFIYFLIFPWLSFLSRIDVFRGQSGCRDELRRGLAKRQ